MCVEASAGNRGSETVAASSSAFSAARYAVETSCSTPESTEVAGISVLVPTADPIGCSAAGGWVDPTCVPGPAWLVAPCAEHAPSISATSIRRGRPTRMRQTVPLRTHS